VIFCFVIRKRPDTSTAQLPADTLMSSLNVQTSLRSRSRIRTARLMFAKSSHCMRISGRLPAPLVTEFPMNAAVFVARGRGLFCPAVPGRVIVPEQRPGWFPCRP